MTDFDFAIWFKDEGDKDQESKFNFDTHLHINVWKIGKEDTIEIGLLFKVPTINFCLNMYIPAKKGEFEFDSISEKLFDLTMLQIFFNDSVAKARIAPSEILVKPEKDESSFFLFKFPDKNDDGDRFYKTKELGPGTVVSINNIAERMQACRAEFTKNPNESIPLPEKVYLRFRISGEFIKKAVKERKLDVSFLQKIVTTIALFDFSINRVRKLPEDFYSNHRGEISSLARFSRIDFFLMIDARERLELSQQNHNVVQLLEGEKWKEYFPVLQSLSAKESVLLYHWKVREPQQDFSLFLETKRSSLSLGRIACLLFGAFCFSLLASIMANLVM